MAKNYTDHNKYFFKSIADEFEQLDNQYDVTTRKNIVFNEFLSNMHLEGMTILDAGCGYGAFSVELKKYNCRLVSSDLIYELTSKTVNKTKETGVVSDALFLPFFDNSFDLVVTSEMVEHTPNPEAVIFELIRVLKPGGHFVLTTPNKKWQFVVRLASTLHLRNFNGIENFLGFRQLDMILKKANVETISHKGLHLFPFQIKFLWKLSTFFDRRFGDKLLGEFMINQAVFCKKPISGE